MLSRLFIAACWERADPLAFVYGVYCVFVTLPCGILGQVWYLIVLFPDVCRLSYFQSPLTLMDFPKHADTIHLGLPIAYFKG